MKKKGLPLIFVIPLMVASILIVGAFGYKLYSDEMTTRTKASEVNKEIPKLKGKDTKPASGFGSMIGPTPSSTPIPTPTTSAVMTKPIDEMTAKDLNAELSGTEDDGGESLLNSLQDDIDGL